MPNESDPQAYRQYETMKILYFAWLREKIGLSEETLELPDTVNDVAGLLGWLKTRGPEFVSALKDDAVIRVAVNQIHAQPHTTIRPADEVALFPPVTGG